MSDFYETYLKKIVAVSQPVRELLAATRKDSKSLESGFQRCA